MFWDYTGQELNSLIDAMISSIENQNCNIFLLLISKKANSILLNSKITKVTQIAQILFYNSKDIIDIIELNRKKNNLF